MNRAASISLHLGLRAGLIGSLSFSCLAASAQSVPLTPASPVAEVRLPEPASTPELRPAATPQPATMANDVHAEPEWRPAAKVGDATLGLLALQASGNAASRTARPITGDLAGRSYQRYLKSFEYPIPERFSASVKSPGLNTGSTP